MVKIKLFLILFVYVFLISSSNMSFAIEDTQVQNKYPDYSYEFTGKDSWENFNRKIFTFNSKFNKYILRPINIVWASVLPQYGLDRVENFYTNLEYPIRLVSCLFQGDFEASRQETVRFLTNTTIGLAGLYDPAKNKFHLEARQEDMGQVLAHYNVKKGPYFVVPIVAQGNTRDVVGKLLDCPLNPALYIVSPITAISGGVSALNWTTNDMQPIVKTIDYTYPDTYEITKELYGIERYIKNENLDRTDVFNEKVSQQNEIKISNVISTQNADLKSDIALENFNSQGPMVDTMRSMLFDRQKLGNSKWADLSVWNRNFNKRMKISSVNVDKNHPNYKYRYILQKGSISPVAVIFPSIGENIMSMESTVMAKILYDAGYSVIIEGSHFQWEFAKCMPDGYKPGLPYQDAIYLRTVTAKILNDIQIKKNYVFDKKIIVGSSFGALAELFAAAQEESQDTLGVSEYIAINPPVEVFYALKQLDKYTQDWKNNPSDIKMRAALASEKIIRLNESVTDKDVENDTVIMPFNEDEAEIAMGFVMKQKLSDLVFILEKDSTIKKSDFYRNINKMSFYDYAQKYLLVSQQKSLDELNYDSSLYFLGDFLTKSKKIKIYHSLDDCFVSPSQLAWLKKQTGKKSVYFSNGSHLGYLYRREFLNSFKNDIKLK